MKNLALLILRLVVGGLLAARGAQRLFGWFGGPNLRGTGNWLESPRLQPGQRWATVAAAAEFVGGLLTMLGLLSPLGPIGILSAVSMNMVKVHGNQPLRLTQSGAELPITNMAAATALGIAGPGLVSVDGVLGTRAPRSWIALVTAAVTTAITLAATKGLRLENEEELA